MTTLRAKASNLCPNQGEVTARVAHAVIDVSVIEVSTNRQLFAQTYTSDELDGSLLALNVGVFGSVDTWRAVADKALTEVVDKALDDTALRSSLQPSAAGAAAMTFEQCFSKCRELTSRSETECFDTCRH
jgi:curli biogenesis system outer membrane secretion channel CsgG